MGKGEVEEAMQWEEAYTHLEQSMDDEGWHPVPEWADAWPAPPTPPAAQPEPQSKLL